MSDFIFTAVQLVAVPISNSPIKMSPSRDQQHLMPRSLQQVPTLFKASSFIIQCSPLITLCLGPLEWTTIQVNCVKKGQPA